MDRARKAGFVGNNYVQNQVREKMRSDHVNRLKKIRNRKPGSSVTLDNNPPDVVNKTGVDPKRKANKELFSLITERENKALLQRISTILTAKPKSNVADYYRMKKLIIPKGSAGSAHERHIQKKRIEKFFKNVRKAEPIYKAKVWEKEYAIQKKNQKFMREVNYKRPPGFVDPFAPKPETPEEEKRERKRLQALKKPVVSPPQPIRRSRAARSAAHVDRVRNVRSSTSPRPGESDAVHGKSARSNCSENSLTDEDTFDENANLNSRNNFEEGEDDEEDVVELAAVEREIRISEEQSTSDYQSASYSSQGDKKLSVYLANAMVECFLVNHEYVVLSALVLDGEDVIFEAEAEISLEDLAVLRNGTESVTQSISGSTQVHDSSGNREENAHVNGSNSEEELHNDDSLVAGAELLEKSESLVQDGNSATYQHTDEQQSLLHDEEGLRSIAADMVQHVEMRVDLESGPRLILNLVSEEEQLMGLLAGTGTLSEPAESFGYARDSDVDRSDSQEVSVNEMGSLQQSAPFSIVSEDELSDMFLEDTFSPFLRKGLQVPVSFSVKAVNSANMSALVDAAQLGLKNENIYCMLKVSCSPDDQMIVKVHVLNSTKTQFKRGLRAAVVKGTNLSLATPLPSVIHADPDLLMTFAHNLSTSVRIEHDSKTGKNKLSVDEQA